MSDGLVIMRGQPVHFGHIRLVEEALHKCAHLYIILGSIQEQGTERNPFSYTMRKTMLKNALHTQYYKHLTILGLRDIFSLGWPNYVLSTIKERYPEANITKIFGGSSYDCSWFPNLEPIIVDRNAPDYPFISATAIREMLTYKDPRWKEYVPECNWNSVAKKYKIDKE